VAALADPEITGIKRAQIVRRAMLLLILCP
jgi:hypothetical protein